MLCDVLRVGILKSRATLFPSEIGAVVQTGTASEIFLWLHSFVIIAMAFCGFFFWLAVPLAFTFSCLFIYFDNPRVTEGICTWGVSGLSRQFLTLSTQGMWLVYIRDALKNNCVEPIIHL